MLFPTNFYPIPIAWKFFTFIKCKEFFCHFLVEKHGFLPKNTIFKSISLAKTAAETISRISWTQKRSKLLESIICICPG